MTNTPRPHPTHRSGDIVRITSALDDAGVGLVGRCYDVRAGGVTVVELLDGRRFTTNYYGVELVTFDEAEAAGYDGSGRNAYVALAAEQTRRNEAAAEQDYRNIR